MYPPARARTKEEGARFARSGSSFSRSAWMKCRTVLAVAKPALAHSASAISSTGTTRWRWAIRYLRSWPGRCSSHSPVAGPRRPRSGRAHRQDAQPGARHPVRGGAGAAILGIAGAHLEDHARAVGVERGAGHPYCTRRARGDVDPHLGQALARGDRQLGEAGVRQDPRLLAAEERAAGHGRGVGVGVGRQRHQVAQRLVDRNRLASAIHDHDPEGEEVEDVAGEIALLDGLEGGDRRGGQILVPRPPFRRARRHPLLEHQVPPFLIRTVPRPAATCQAS